MRAMPAGTSEAVEGRFLAANGTRIFYREHGRGRPLVLLHGGTLSGDSWEPYLPDLVGPYRVIVPDTPGHGRSGAPAATLSYPGLADDIAAFITALDLRAPLVAGYSDGGQIALELGMRHPSLAGALVLGGTFFRFNAAYDAWLTGVFGEATTAEEDGERLRRNHPEWAAWLERIYGPEAWPAVVARVKPMWTTPFDYSQEALARVAAPALVLVGDRDEVLPVEEAVELYRRLPAGELAVVPGADHGDFFFARVGLFQAPMLDFLRRQDARPA
jgi:pimeloyl-ACP methyl ester carboxylesterase